MRFSLCFCMYSVVRFHCVGNKISKNLCAIVFNLQFISLIFFICIQDTHLYASIWALYGCVCVCRGTLYYFSFLEPVFFFFFSFILRKCQCLSQSLSILYHAMKMRNQKKTENAKNLSSYHKMKRISSITAWYDVYKDNKLW